MQMAYKYLAQYQKAEIAIQQRKQELEALRAQAEYRGQVDGERVQSSTAGDTLAIYVARITEAERRLWADLEQQLLLRTRIVTSIQALPNSRHCDLLYRRYVECKSFRQIAREMQYSPEYIRNHLHPAALQAMGKYLRD